MKKELKGRRYKNASSRETYEIFDAEPDFLKHVARVLQVQFDFRQQGKTLVGPDQVFMDFSNGDVILVLGWDIWSGCFIYAEQPEGDARIITIGKHLDSVLNTL